MLKQIKQIFTKLVYPDGLCCLLCGKELSGPSGDGLCSECGVHYISHRCRKCGVMLKNMQRDYCDLCLNLDADLFFDAASAPFCYEEDNVKKLVWQLKYNGKRYVAAGMAKPMSEELKKQDWNVDLITYVPLHKKRRRKRGYNQSELLALAVGENLGLPVVDTMSKLTYTKKTATKLGRRERIKLLEGSFALKNADIKGKNVLLIDDVMTTRATANECSRMLKLGKAKRVYVMTYATSRGDKTNNVQI